VWEFNLGDEPAIWKSFALDQNDLVVFTWHIEQGDALYLPKDQQQE
jgi:hypothetical protein